MKKINIIIIRYPILSIIIPYILIIVGYKISIACCDTHTLWEEMNVTVSNNNSLSDEDKAQRIAAMKAINGSVVKDIIERSIAMRAINGSAVTDIIKERSVVGVGIVAANIISTTPEDIPLKETTMIQVEERPVNNDANSNNESNDVPLLKELKILDNLSDLLNKCTTYAEIVSTCIKYVGAEVPSTAWATQPELLGDQTSSINIYIDSFTENVEAQVITDEQRIMLAHYRAAISTYNAAAILKVLNNAEILETTFKSALSKMLIETPTVLSAPPSLPLDTTTENVVYQSNTHITQGLYTKYHGHIPSPFNTDPVTIPPADSFQVISLTEIIRTPGIDDLDPMAIDMIRRLEVINSLGPVGSAEININNILPSITDFDKAPYQDIISNKPAAPEYIRCFQTLETLARNTQNPILIQFVAKYHATHFIYTNTLHPNILENAPLHAFNTYKELVSEYTS